LGFGISFPIKRNNQNNKKKKRIPVWKKELRNKSLRALLQPISKFEVLNEILSLNENVESPFLKIVALYDGLRAAVLYGAENPISIIYWPFKTLGDVLIRF